MALSLRDRLKLFTVDEIKAELKSLNAICTGVKDVLVDRLAYYIERNSSTRDPSDGNIFDCDARQSGPTIYFIG